MANLVVEECILYQLDQLQIVAHRIRARPRQHHVEKVRLELFTAIFDIVGAAKLPIPRFGLDLVLHLQIDLQGDPHIYHFCVAVVAQ